jgi:lysyl-tRNA synthetase class 2
MTVHEPEDQESSTDAEVRFQAGIRARRLEKLRALRTRGVEPYPVRFDRDSTAAEIRQAHAGLTPGAVTSDAVRLAGRLMAQRRHGGLIFAELRDETGTIQLMVARDQVGEQPLLDFSDLDLGDWIGVW